MTFSIQRVNLCSDIVYNETNMTMIDFSTGNKVAIICKL